MKNYNQEITDLFLPGYTNEIKRISRPGFRFAHYTCADAATQIIQKGEIRFSNSRNMNDFADLRYGLDSLAEAFKNPEHGKSFKQLLKEIYPDFLQNFIDYYENWIPTLEDSTYFACFSEHDPSEDMLGRLSMWRAYGGDCPVAIVFNNTAFTSSLDGSHVFMMKMNYKDNEKLIHDFNSLGNRFHKNKELIASVDEAILFSDLFMLFQIYAFGMKHQGFKDELEWRLVYKPKIANSDNMLKESVTINGLEQDIYKLKFEHIPEINVENMIPQPIERVIIGPCDNQVIRQRIFIDLLYAAGYSNAEEKVFVSGIPLRRQIRKQT